MKLSVLGAGAWGTALACSAAAQHEVLLWARDPSQAAHLAQEQRNERYLPGIGLPPGLRVSASWEEALSHAQSGLLVIATPMSGLRSTLQRLPAQAPVLWLCKGFEAGSGALGHEIAHSLRPHAPSGVLSGPSFAQEVAQGRPTALVAASYSPALCEQAVQAFHGGALRIYTSQDPTGVEVGGAVKNVMAIATGILDGLAARGDGSVLPGLNARAALITRGLAEMTRLGLALGAKAETFMGLSGLGDLVLTSTGALSRNRQVGLMLAEGRSLNEAVAALGHVAEGVYSAATVLERARSLGVDMPITAAVVEVLQGRLAPAQAVGRLMSRGARPEGL
ncbi:MAG: NAD(P)H-dependent glycerol-3-phosphate dehydrogenase [Rubrivivax sp.]